MQQEIIDGLIDVAQESNAMRTLPLAIAIRRVQALVTELPITRCAAFVDVMQGVLNRTNFLNSFHKGELSEAGERALTNLHVQRLKHWLKDANPDIKLALTALEGWRAVPPAYSAMRGMKAIVVDGHLYCRVRDVRVIGLLHKSFRLNDQADLAFCHAHLGSNEFMWCDPYTADRTAPNGSKLKESSDGRLWTPLHCVFRLMRDRPGIAAQLEKAQHEARNTI